VYNRDLVDVNMLLQIIFFFILSKIDRFKIVKEETDHIPTQR